MAPSERLQLAWFKNKTAPRDAKRDLARATSLTQDKISKILRGERNIKPLEWNEIAEFFKEAPPGFEAIQQPELGSEDVAAELGNPTARRGRPGIPIISWVNAGKFADLDVDIPTTRLDHVFAEDLGPGEFFATRVRGDSMNLVAPEGSLIIVNHRERNPISGNSYIFSVKGQTTFKEYQKGKPPFMLPRSTNPEHRPGPIEKRINVEIVGRVRRVIHDL